MTMLAFIQNVGPLEWLVLGGCFLVPLVLVVVAMILVFTRRSNLEARVARLEQLSATSVPTRPPNP